MANLRTNNLSGEQGQNAIRGSVFFDGTGDKLSVPNSADVRLGSNDFTMEAWVKFGDVQGTWDTILGMYDEGNDRRAYHLVRYRNAGAAEDGRLYMYVNTDGTSGGYANVSGGFLSINDWHHVAGVRDGNTLRVYINGVQVGSSSFSGTIYNNTTDPLFIGDVESDDTKIMNGFISNVRLINGTCIYPNGTTFTPPQQELTLVPNTVLLACQNSDDVTQEATGKTITAAGNLTDAAYVRMQPKVIPPYGVDAGNTFGGPIQQSSQGYMYFPTGRTEERGRGRAVFMGGSQTPNTPKIMDTIDYVEMTTSGVGVRFGSLTTTNCQSAAFASSTRGINAGGQTSAPGDNQTNIIEFVTIATEGNGTDFGDLDTVHRRFSGGGHSSETRGIITGGSGDSPGETNVIQFVTIASIGNATDFGDLLNPKDNMMSKNGSSTRMLICGGRDYTPSATVTNVIEFLTIATTGNSADFGDLTQARFAGTGCGSATRGIIAGGQTPTYVNTIDYVTIASTGNATDFGDLTATNSFLGGASNSIKGIFAGGATPTKLSTIQSIEIATTGDAVAFGDNTATNPVTSRGTCSDSHGGLT